MVSPPDSHQNWFRLMRSGRDDHKTLNPFFAAAVVHIYVGQIERVESDFDFGRGSKLIEQFLKSERIVPNTLKCDTVPTELSREDEVLVHTSAFPECGRR